MSRFFALVFLWVSSLAADEIRVATFNIRYDAKGDRGQRDWRARRALVSETIRLMKPDVLGLQEVVHGQLDDLKKAHPEFVTIGVARDDGKKRGEYSPLFVRRSRFKIDSDERGTFWLSDTPEEAGSVTWGNACTRVCTWARLIDKETGQALYVFNTHWDHKSQHSRQKSAVLIRDRILAREKSEEAVILMGDFNASEVSPEMKTLTEGAEFVLKNAFLLCHPDGERKGTFNSWRADGGQGAMIDHLLVSPELAVKEAEIVRHQREGQVPSDHFPIRMICEW